MSDETYPAKAKQITGGMRQMGKELPEVMGSFGKLHDAAVSANALDTKVKELMALAISVAVKCDGCIAFHSQAAIKAGASREEFMDAVGVAVLMGGGPAAVYATHAVEAFDQFSTA